MREKLVVTLAWFVEPLCYGRDLEGGVSSDW